ncbi:hypothetical protein AncyloWKF20_05330 [Ancylobacter sp. WKF20]|uniref:hypothetical protein n=1 Tax=Ancylobacter sp. WKF20 TaxID=3039801 RepID=UPI00243443AC|nr:hypothetical protein [Ancylobacter sp. WKF20]WGD31247.1 hypothetical protein AncyloWKF20_05330 [Ancylobacter sp. WKF20]
MTIATMDKATLRQFRDSVSAGGYIGGADDVAIAAFGAHAMLAQNATTGAHGIDAAVAFTQAMLPGWYWRCGRTLLDDGAAHVYRLKLRGPGGMYDLAAGLAPTPAKALVVAVLSALIEFGEAPHG